MDDQVNPRKFVDVYEDKELRQVYSEMFPGCVFDDDCWFPFVAVGGWKLLIDASLSLALDDPEGEHFPFYSDKGEKRVRAAQQACKSRKRESVNPDKSREIKADSRYPVVVGVTGREDDLPKA